ncbi:MAG TPA: hypothetical protein VG815_16920 [Chloroflexota bacterium]|nr:hypothetical protein [Chloroflexota bacterium]
MNPSQDQILSLVRSIITILGGIAISRGFLTDEQITLIGGIVASLIPLVWGMMAHTNAAKLASVAAMPGPDKLVAFQGIPDGAKLASVEAMPQVQKIIVDRNATDGIADAAKDPDRPKVVTDPVSPLRKAGL